MDSVELLYQPRIGPAVRQGRSVPDSYSEDFRLKAARLPAATNCIKSKSASIERRELELYNGTREELKSIIQTAIR